MPSINWRKLLRQTAESAAAFARFSAGSSIDARMAMIAITTSSSTSVNAEPAFGGWPRADFIVTILRRHRFAISRNDAVEAASERGVHAASPGDSPGASVNIWTHYS